MILWAVAGMAGLVVGYGSRGLVRDRTVDRLSKSVPSVLPASHSVKAASSAMAAKPRPSLEDVLSAEGSEQLNLLARFLPEATLDEVELIADAWEFTVDAKKSPQFAWKLLLARWLDLDPEGAFVVGEEIDKTLSYWFNRYLCQTWAAKDLEAALAFAESDAEKYLLAMIPEIARQDINRALLLVNDYPDITGLAGPVLQRLAKSDPLAALEKAGALADTKSYPGLMKRILSTWMKSDPDAVLDYWNTSSLTDRQRRAMREPLIRSIMAEQPEKAERALKTFYSPGKQRYDLFKSLATQRAQKDPEAALVWAENQPQGIERVAGIAIAGRALTKGVPEKVFEFLDRVGWEYALPNAADGSEVREFNGGGGSYSSGGSLHGLLKESLQKLAKEDPMRALAIAAKLPSHEFGYHESPRGDTVEEIAKTWMINDPSGYVKWLGSSGFEDIPHGLRPSVRELSQDAAEKLADDLSRMDAGAVRSTLALELARKFAESDPARAFAMADNLEPKLREQQLSNIFSSVAHRDPEAGLQYFEQLDSKSQQGVAGTLISSLANNNFELAQGWFASQPDEVLGNYGYEAMTQAWYKEDALQASEWVAALPVGDQRDAAAASLASALATDARPDFDAALQWAESIEDLERRQGGLQNVFWSLLRRDRAAGEAAVRASSLPENMKGLLLKN